MFKKESVEKDIFVFLTSKIKYLAVNTLIHIRYTKINPATYIDK